MIYIDNQSIRSFTSKVKFIRNNLGHINNQTTFKFLGTIFELMYKVQNLKIIWIMNCVKMYQGLTMN